MENKVYLMDCMEGMKQYPDKYFDLAVVDPPYGLKKSSTHGSGKLKNRILNNGNIQKWDIAPNEYYFKELFRVSKNQIIWGGNYFNLPPTRCVICWDKCQPWENFSQWEMAWTSFDKPAPIFRFNNKTKNKIHPTQKPTELYDKIFKNYSKQEMKILDTHVGSGSSRIAAHRAKLDFIGFEIDSDYYAAQEKRFNIYKSQLTMDL